MQQMLTFARRRSLLLLLCVFFVWRMCFLLTSQPFHLFIFPHEELYRGAIARDLVEGLRMPFFQYRADDYSGGSLAIGFLVSLFFRGLGSSLLILKLVPLFFSMGGLVFWYLLLSRYQSAKTAVYFSLIYIFAPLAFVRYSVLPLGDHTETIFFTGCSLFLFLEIVTERNKSWVYPVLLGLVSGLALWIAYIYFLTILTLVLFGWVYYRRALLSRKFLLVWGSFFIGFSPWLMVNFSNHFSGFRIQEEDIWNCFQWSHFVSRIFDFKTFAVTRFLTSFEIYHVMEKIPQYKVILFYIILFLAPVTMGSFYFLRKNQKVSLFRKWRKPNLVVLSSIYFFIFCFITQWTSFINLRYYIPTHPFIYFVVAYFVRWIQKEHPRVPLLFFSVLISSALYFQGALFSWKDFGYALRTPGYSYLNLVDVPVCSDALKCLEVYQNFQNQLSIEEKGEFLRIVSDRMAHQISEMEWKQELISVENKIPKFAVPSLYLRLGHRFGTAESWNLDKGLAEFDDLKILNPQKYEILFRGFLDGYSQQEMNEKDLAFLELVPSGLPPALIPDYFRMRGIQWARLIEKQSGHFRDFRKQLRITSQNMNQKTQPFFLQGVGVTLYEKWLWKHLSLRKIKKLPLNLEYPVLQGMGMGAVLRPTPLGWALADAVAEEVRGERKRFVYEGKSLAEKSVALMLQPIS